MATNWQRLWEQAQMVHQQPLVPVPPQEQGRTTMERLLKPIPTGLDYYPHQNWLGAALNPLLSLPTKSALGWGSGLTDAYEFMTSKEGEYQKEHAPPPPEPAKTFTPTLAPPAQDVTAPAPQVPRSPSSTPVSAPGLHPTALLMAQRMREAGYSDAAIAGVVGNVSQESGFRPTVPGDNGTSYGLFQHRDPKPGAGRKTDLFNWAAERGMNPADPDTQIQFALNELETTHTRAGQGLRSAQSPADAAAAFLHFEKPQGYDPERFNPAAVHGWGNRLTEAQKAYAALTGQELGGNLLPPSVEPYSVAPPPARPMPLARPARAAPDYAATNQWYEQARPTPTDPAALKRQTMLNAFAGIAEGAAAVNPNQVGGTAQLLASMGAGGLRGRQQGEAREALAQDEFQKALQRYAQMRGGVESGQAGTAADFSNTGADRTWQNRSDVQDTGFANQLDAFKIAEANRAGAFEAGQLNKQNLFDYRQRAAQALLPREVSATKEGVITEQGGKYDFQTFPNAGTNFYDLIENIGKWPEPYRSQGLAELTAKPGNEQMAIDQGIRQAVTSGSAPMTMGQIYPQAVEAARAQVAASRPDLEFTDPELFQTEFNNALVQNLKILSMNDPQWIQQEAAMGNPWAIKFMQANGQ